MGLAKLKPLRDPTEIELPPMLVDHPQYRPVAAEFEALQARLKEAERREKIADARASGQQPTKSIAERAKALVSGGSVIASSPAAEKAAAIEEQNLLSQAIQAKREELDALAGKISFEIERRFAPMSAEAKRNALEHAKGLHESLEVDRKIDGLLIGRGYSLNDAARPRHLFPDGAKLGDPDRVGMTPAALFKQWLHDKGII